MTCFFKKSLVFFIFTLLFSASYMVTGVWADSSLPPMPNIDSAAPIQVHGDTVEYFQDEQKAVGTGNVSIDYEGVHLEADKITVLMVKKVAIAEGNVVLKQKGSEFKGARAEYDFGTKVGHVSQMDASIDPSYYGKAKKIEKISDTHYRAQDSYVTTCCGDSPFYKIQANQIDIYPDDKIVIRNALLFIRGIPVIFIPYYVQYFLDFDRFPVQFIPGKTSQWGAFVLSKWRYNLIQRPDLQSKGNFLLDYRQKQGFGGGVENFYRGDSIGRGAVRAYFANDQEVADFEESDRSRVQVRHQSKVGEATTLTVEMNKLSDANMIKDYFFREEYEKDVFPDNYVSLITAKPEYTLSILDRERLDDFYTVVERSPEVRFDTHNQALFETPFYLRQEAQFSNLKKRFAGGDTGLDTLRMDTNHTLSYAGHLGDLSVIPRVGSRQTYYSRQVSGDEDLVRGTFDPGLDLSIRFYKIYNVTVRALGLDINQVRHIFSPTASYFFRPNPTQSRSLLQQFDSLDAIDKQNFVRINFENKFQTKEHSASGELVTREIARIIPFFDADFDTHHLENVGIDVELKPYSWLGLESDATYNSRTRDFESANFDVYLTRGPWEISMGQRYVQDESSQTTAQIYWKPNTDWEVKVYDRFEFQEGASKEFEITVSKAFECVITDFTYNHGNGDSFYFALRLKAFPTVPFSFSQSYNRPKALPSNRAVI